jgi:ankyrin repeat protein
MMASSLPAPTPEFQAILERLLMICSTGTLLELQDVLQNSPVIEVALAIQMHSLEAVQLPMHNLRLMLQEACQAGKASIVEFLLKFAKEHKISLDKLIWRQVVYSAIESNDLATFQALAAELPQVIDFDLGHCGTPLSRAVGRLSRNFRGYSDIRTPLVAYLLQNGADANGSPYHRPLKIASSYGSINTSDLLLAHGASITGVGALYCAAKYGRIDVLESLFLCGTDVNERVGDIAAGEWYGHPPHSSQVASETAMHIAVRERQYETVRWLKEHGANTDLEDARDESPRMVAEYAGDERILTLF